MYFTRKGLRSQVQFCWKLRISLKNSIHPYPWTPFYDSDYSL